MWLVFRYALAGLRAAGRERRELALENIALRHQVEVLTLSRRRPHAAGGPAAVVIAVPRVAELATTRGDRATGHCGALASHGMASLLEVEEPGCDAWPSPH